MMFQGGALLDSLTVFDNLAFPLREHTRLGEKEIAARSTSALDAVGLADVDELLPGQLSGGMIKRAALARAIIRTPGDPALRRAVLRARSGIGEAHRGAADRASTAAAR